MKKEDEKQPNYFMVASGYTISFMLLFSALFGLGDFIGEATIVVRAVAAIVAGIIIVLVNYYLKQFKGDDEK